MTGLPGRPLSTYVPSLTGLTCLLFFPFPVYLPRSPRRPHSAPSALSSPASIDGQVSKTISHASRLCQAFSRCFSAFFSFPSGRSQAGREKILAATYFPAVAAVSSAHEGLTSVFGMGTGIAPPLWPPGITYIFIRGPAACPALTVRASAPPPGDFCGYRILILGRKR